MVGENYQRVWTLDDIMKIVLSAQPQVFYAAHHCSLGFPRFAAKCTPDTSIPSDETEKDEDDSVQREQDERERADR